MPKTTPACSEAHPRINTASPILHRWLLALTQKFQTPVRFVDAQGHADLSHTFGPRPPSYCDLVAKDPALSKKCQDCNRHHAALAWGGMAVGSYTCHAGLTDITLPIRPRGKPVGVLLTGRIRLNQGGERDFQKLPKIPVAGAFHESQWRGAWERLPLWNQATLDGFLAHLELVAARIAANHVPGQLPKRLDVAQILSHTRANLHHIFYLEDLAATFGVSQSNLSAMFRRDSGMGFTQWLLWLRLGEAWSQLSRKKNTVSEVAKACGFLDLPYFSKAFKRRFDRTPQDVLLGRF